jgi:cytidylate kinase
MLPSSAFVRIHWLLPTRGIIRQVHAIITSFISSTKIDNILSMAAITISRQLGSLGEDVAQKVGQKLGYRVVSRDLVNQAATQCKAPVGALEIIDDLGLLNLHPTTQDRRAFLLAIRQVMEKLADCGGIIILGRAGQIILGKRSDVLHVRVNAPKYLRAERVAHQLNIPHSAALAQVRASDRSKRDYLRRYYHVQWDNPELYDLILNTARLSPDQGADLICQAFEHCSRKTSLHVARIG